MNQNISNNEVRCDGRSCNELRPIKFITTPVSNLVEFYSGSNIAAARVQLISRPNPKNINYEVAECTIDCRYSMMPWSTKDRFSAKSYSNRRCVEISLVIERVFSNVILKCEYPRQQVYLIVNMIQTEGGSRVSAINALSLSLALSTIAHRALPIATSFGKTIEGQIVVDVNGVEDQTGLADVPIAIEMPTGRIGLLQMEGELTFDEFKHGLALAKAGIQKIYQELKMKINNYQSE